MFDDVFLLDSIEECKKSKYYNIVICSDKNIVDPIFVLIYSIYKNCKRNINIWILQKEYTKIQKHDLVNFCNKLNIKINIIDVNPDKYMKFNIKRLPVETYFYLDIQNILPNSIDRALVVDVDTIILKDIGYLYDIDFGDKYIVAGNEYDDFRYESYIDIINGKKEHEVNIKTLYNTENCFNSGVMLFNVKKMRDDNISIDNYLEVVKPEDIGGFFHDQLVINRFMKGRVKLFPRIFYNCSSVEIDHYIHFFEKKDKKSIHEVFSYNSLDNEKIETIIHFCGIGAIKPWKAEVNIDTDNGITVLNTSNPQQNKYIEKWWKYALEVPNNIFFRLFNNMFYHNNNITEYKSRISYLESELDIFKIYSNYFAEILQNKNTFYNVISFFISNRYYNIAFYGLSRLTVTLVPLLREYNIQTKYIMENLNDDKILNCDVYSRVDRSIPFVDCIIVADVKNVKTRINNLQKYVSCPVISVLDLVKDFKENYKKNKYIKNYMYYRDISEDKRKEELCLWYKHVTGMDINLDNPRTFNEKIQWSKIYDTTSIKTILSDKFLVRDWIKEKIGEKYLIPLIGVYNKPEEIDFKKLPESFVIKCNHGSGMNIIINDKNKIDINNIIYKLKEWMSIDYSFMCGFEMQYHNIDRKIIIEKKIQNGDNGDLYDYKFWCFNGKVKFIQFLSERNISGLKMAFYDTNWNKQDFVYDYPLDDKNIDKPANLNEMIALSEKLSSGFNHVRVDFYRLDDGTILFGEMTFTSDSGKCKWSNSKINEELGDLFYIKNGEN